MLLVAAPYAGGSTRRREPHELEAVLVTLEKLAWLVVAAMLGPSCTTVRQPALPLVHTRAPKDLDCPDKRIHVTEELGGRYRATGCGRTLVYRSACEGLQCSVGLEGDESVPGWRDRPEPGTIEDSR